MSDPVRTSVLRMVASAFPSLVYGHPRTYIVAAVNADGTLDLVPPPDAPHLPELRRVEQWSVVELVPAKGTSVAVLFLDANPARPVVIGARVTDVEDEATPPVVDPTGRFIRWGDKFAGVVTGAYVATAFTGIPVSRRRG